MKRKTERDRWGEPLSKLTKLRRQPQAPLDFGARDYDGPYDPRRHPFVVTAIERKTGGFEPDNSGIIIWLDVRDEIAAGLRDSRGNWLGEETNDDVL